MASRRLRSRSSITASTSPPYDSQAGKLDNTFVGYNTASQDIQADSNPDDADYVNSSANERSYRVRNKTRVNVKSTGGNRSRKSETNRDKATKGSSKRRKYTSTAASRRRNIIDESSEAETGLDDVSDDKDDDDDDENIGNLSAEEDENDSPSNVADPMDVDETDDDDEDDDDDDPPHDHKAGLSQHPKTGAKKTPRSSMSVKPASSSTKRVHIDEKHDIDSAEGDEDAIGEDDDDLTKDADGPSIAVVDNEEEEDEEEDDDDIDVGDDEDDDESQEFNVSRASRYGAAGQKPDPSKLTRRQRANHKHQQDGELLALSNEAQRKKHLTAEEYAMRRQEMARRRKNLSEKRNEEEKLDTINRLLKKQASKRRNKYPDIAAGEVASEDVPVVRKNSYGETVEEIVRPSPIFARLIRNVSGVNVVCFPEEWIDYPNGLNLASSIPPIGSESHLQTTPGAVTPSDQLIASCTPRYLMVEELP